MKKLFVILIVAMLFSPSLLAQKRTGPDREFFGFKGPVKTVRLEIANIKSRDGKNVEERRRLIFSTTYDEKGNMVEEVRHNQDESVEERKVFIHDGFRRQKATAYTGDGTVISTTVYSYDDEGKLITSSAYREDGALLRKEKRVYDANGKLVEVTIYDEDDSIVDKTIFKYDSEGKQAEDTVYFADGGISQRHVRNGNEEDTVIGYGTDGHIAFQMVYRAKSLEYDSHGNWIKQMTPTELTGPGLKEEYVEVVYRTITYY